MYIATYSNIGPILKNMYIRYKVGPPISAMYIASNNVQTTVYTRTSATPDNILEILRPSFTLLFSEKFIIAVIKQQNTKNLTIQIAISCGIPSKLKRPITKPTTKNAIIMKGIAIMDALVATVKNNTGLNNGKVSSL